MFTIWVALGDMGRDQGCLRFAGTDVREVFPHRMLEYGPGEALSALLIDPAEFDVSSLGIREIRLQAGWAAVFDSFTVHGAYPNASERPRLSFKLVIGDREQRTAPGGSRVMTLDGSAYELNRRLGFAPAYVGLNIRDAVASRGRRVLRRLRGIHGAR
jgi:ectoine hydroxylase-related dioxygenase (phytanoyl-CoA dioxygenase family)